MFSFGGSAWRRRRALFSDVSYARGGDGSKKRTISSLVSNVAVQQREPSFIPLVYSMHRREKEKERERGRLVKRNVVVVADTIYI
jgi:hypothetical protein